MYEYRLLEKESYLEGRTLLEKDKLPFDVLVNILGSPIEKIITNGTDVIIACSVKMFPVWIWMPDNCSDEKKEEIYQLFKETFVPLTDYRINTKYEMAEYILKRLNEDGFANSKIMTNVVTYTCEKPVMPSRKPEGYLQRLTSNDYELAVKMIKEASSAIGDTVLSDEAASEAAKEQLDKQVLYVWRNSEGTAVSFCDRNENTNYVKISQCYTPEEYRGNGYAAELIYELCGEIVESGRIAMLYADADYESSNRCYQKIGFVQDGKIATIGIYE